MKRDNPFLHCVDVLDDRKRVRAVLLDCFPTERVKANVLVIAYDSGIISAIRDSEIIDDALINRLEKRLITDYAMNSNMAQWAVRFWVEMYGAEILRKTMLATTGHSQGNDASDNDSVLVGFILLKDANVDWARFRKNLKDDWDITFEDEIKDGAVVFKVDDMTVACSLLPSPVPDHEAEEAAKRNILWNDGANAVAKHQAHMIVAVMNKFDALNQQELLAKVACSLLKLDNAIGIYKAPTVYDKEFYINFAKTIDEGECPVPIYVYVGMYIDEKKVYAFTSGMSVFGKLEMEITGTEAEPDDVLNFMYSICEYVITEDIELNDGETIGFTEDQKVPIEISQGVSVDGDTVKIGFSELKSVDKGASVDIETLKDGDKLLKSIIVIDKKSFTNLGIRNITCVVRKDYTYGMECNLKITGEYEGKASKSIMLVFMCFNPQDELIGTQFGETIDDIFNGSDTYSTCIKVPRWETIERIELRAVLHLPMG